MNISCHTCFSLFFFNIIIHLSHQSQLVVKEEIEELKSIVINTDENEAAQGYGKSWLNICGENLSVET